MKAQRNFAPPRFRWFLDSGGAFRTALSSPRRLGYDVIGSIKSFTIRCPNVQQTALPFNQQGSALLPSARHRLHSACAINTHLQRSLGSHVISTQPVHVHPHHQESKSSVPLWFAVAIRPTPSQGDMRTQAQPTLEWRLVCRENTKTSREPEALQAAHGRI